MGSPKGRAVVALSHAFIISAGHAIKNFARYRQGSVSIHERPKTVDSEPRAAIGRVTSSFVSAQPVLVLHERKSR